MSNTKCGAQRRSDGGPCQQPPSRGGLRCRFHGGASPQAKRRAEQRLVEADAMKALAKYGFEPIESPVEELAKLGGEALSMKNFLLRRVTSDSVSGGEALAFERWLDRCERMLTNLARLNIDERRTALAQRQAGVVVEAMTILIGALGHDVSDPEVRASVVMALTTAQENAVTRELMQR
jgi:hypothetical protein